MISPGSPFSYADLGSLAALANTVNGITYPGFFDVAASLMTLDGSGNPWGYRAISAVVINQPGSGYKAGDIVTLNYTGGSATDWPTFMIELVAGTGQVHGLRSVFSGAGSYSDPSSFTNAAMTGGSGSGLTINATYAQIGPHLVSYSFPDFINNLATLTWVNVVYGGSGFNYGDTLELPDIPSVVLTVATVGSGGAIVAAAVAGGANATVPTDWAAMPGVYTSGAPTDAIFAGGFTFPPRPAWLDELNRLRTNLWTVMFSGTNLVPQAELYCSVSSAGVGWPKSPYTNSVSYWDPSSNYQQFYYAGSSAQTITLSAVCEFAGAAHDGMAPYSISVITEPQYPAGPYQSNESAITAASWTFKLKCPPGATLSGTVSVLVTSGTLNLATGTGSAETPSMTGTGSLGNPSFTSIAGTPNGYLATFTFSGLTDGEYTVGLTGGFVTATPTTGSTAYNNFIVNYCVVGFGNITSDSESTPAGLHIDASFSPTLTFTAVQTAGIDNNAKVWVIGLPTLDNPPVGFGMSFDSRTTNFGATWPPGTSVSYGPDNWSVPIIYATLAISNGTEGFWVGSTQPVNSLFIPPETAMPWNYNITKYGSSGSVSVNPMLLADLAPNSGTNGQQSNSYDIAKTVEKQLEPPIWRANTYFTVGFTILDANGNFQQVQTAGTSGSAAPNWTTTAGATNTDGGVTWHCVANPVPIKPAQQAIHRQLSLPRYPVYWYSETNPKLMPPTSTSGLTVWGAYDQWYPANYNGSGYDPGWHKATSSDTQGAAFGWWIYRLAVNRIASASGSLNVTIGCMRNTGSGSVFVAFDTFATGATYQVLWPIFTSDALVYQCSERVDIQALAICSTASGVSIGSALVDPQLIAACVTDVTAILGLVP